MDARRAWLDAAIAPEDRPETLSAREVADIDQRLCAAVGLQSPSAKLLAKAGGEAAVASWYNSMRAASALGRKGGAAKSKAKADAARANGAKGGRPRSPTTEGSAEPAKGE